MPVSKTPMAGRFAAHGPWRFEIGANPLACHERADAPVCHWHAAVFERLYRVLVAPDCRCRETACCGQPDVAACRFVVCRAG
jgi:divinyl protochlorophyllide a 8-vinyl-reductase